MATFVTTFSDTNGKGTIKLYPDHLNGDSSYVGRFDRKTVDINTLIARIQEKKAGTNELALQHSAAFIKEEVIEALSKGEAVNLLDLGTLYISVNVKFDGSAAEKKQKADKKTFRVKFTPSPLVQSAVDSIEIERMYMANVGPEIISIKDNYTGLTDGTVSAGKDIEIKGKNLKLDDSEASGIYFCPLDEKGNIATDESRWLKSKKVIYNKPQTIRCYVPDDIDKTAEYKILLRTSKSSRNRQPLKEKREALSGIIKVV